ncbi:pentatricopeptide repeat-containing protein At3g06920-like isoform X2 [Arabidopsis lyrata subsp. lyrata]|uniref:pentatricopeptide repeat-containing protein At3g06920-like isoform X2 n=1 Tax=Arabidopsis lyrata subsp. lyrata TaxID=81972 RepID=UPI000A29D1D6|nr:pentatricopeptide repeat-containing protein At3g06920-like isoform X2 [Arabidopsis lyrata subsp. lyrata]XP_020886626.1 pentatricopeptide repeat-containing protein At3g06920-like isoform X2 [Arabidopsis lyrata subsp. lyrata]|eukprot:XP_020886624.1 pentatricopeptide repeat-containing protein At3g06920-like isoform X2 [Arabidopsis lyrata subsp. lyrata]
MRMLLRPGIIFHTDIKSSRVVAVCKHLSSLSDNGENHEKPYTFEGNRQIVNDICNVLETGAWGPSAENALSALNFKPQPEFVIGVLRRLKDVNRAIEYFRWYERRTELPHCPESYNSLLLVMARCRNFDALDQILGEMSVAGFGPSVNTCIEMVLSCVKANKLREGFDVVQNMRKFKFRPAFSAYTTLIGAFSAVNHSDMMLTLFQQMQELGYEPTVHLFTTLIRSFAKEGRVDSALSLLDEMKSSSLDADIVLYNVCIDSFGKVGKVDMAWKFFHEIEANGLKPDEVTYTSMIGVLCKANRLDEAVEMFEHLEKNRRVPCTYAYNTMIMGYGSAGKFDEAYSLPERQRAKGSIPSVITYNCILTCLRKMGKVVEALKVFEETNKDLYKKNSSIDNLNLSFLCYDTQDLKRLGGGNTEDSDLNFLLSHVIEKHNLRYGNRVNSC